MVDIPFSSCAFPPTQFDSNLTRQLYNQAQGILSLFEIRVIVIVIVTSQPHARWLADGRIWELKHLVQSGHCANGSTTVHPGGTLRHLDLKTYPEMSLKVGICDFDYAGTSDQFQLWVCSKESHREEEYSDCCRTESSGHVARWWSMQQIANWVPFSWKNGVSITFDMIFSWFMRWIMNNDKWFCARQSR